MTAPVERLYVGRIGRPVGLRGEIEIAVASDAPDRFAPGAVLSTNARTLTVRAHRVHGERTIVAFEGIDDRSQAEALKGAELFVEAQRARALDEGEYWDHDLIGCTVVALNGDSIGEVTDVLHHGANEVLVVRAGTKEHLVPLVADIVKSVHPRERIMIDPLPGLLD
jgi:16S rRNA processing protein RimM